MYVIFAGGGRLLELMRRGPNRRATSASSSIDEHMLIAEVSHALAAPSALSRVCVTGSLSIMLECDGIVLQTNRARGVVLQPLGGQLGGRFVLHTAQQVCFDQCDRPIPRALP